MGTRQREKSRRKPGRQRTAMERQAEPDLQGLAELSGRLPLPGAADDYGVKLLSMKGSVADDVEL